MQLLIGCQQSCQLIRNHIRKSRLVNQDFIPRVALVVLTPRQYHACWYLCFLCWTITALSWCYLFIVSNIYKILIIPGHHQLLYRLYTIYIFVFHMLLVVNQLIICRFCHLYLNFICTWLSPANPSKTLSLVIKFDDPSVWCLYHRNFNLHPKFICT